MKTFDEIVASKRVFKVNKGFLNSGFIKLPDAGTCTLLWGDNEDGWEHVSISPNKMHKIPSWNDMCILKDIFFNDEEEVLQLHPKKSQYVNISTNCLHLWRPKGLEIMLTLENAMQEVE